MLSPELRIVSTTAQWASLYRNRPRATPLPLLFLPSLYYLQLFVATTLSTKHPFFVLEPGVMFAERYPFIATGARLAVPFAFHRLTIGGIKRIRGVYLRRFARGKVPENVLETRMSTPINKSDGKMPRELSRRFLSS